MFTHGQGYASNILKMGHVGKLLQVENDGVFGTDWFGNNVKSQNITDLLLHIYISQKKNKQL